MPPCHSFVRLSVRLSVNRSVNHIFRFLHICWQVTGKEWHRVRNADVSRWLTLGQHWCRWVLLSFHAFVRPSNHPWTWVCVLHTKRLEEMAYNLACWCIQMAYTQHSWMLMDIVVGLSVRPSVRLFVYGIFRWLCICWQITWNKWHKIWHADVSPSLISLSQHLGFFFFLGGGGGGGAKEGGSHYWEMAVAITCGYGGYLLPLLAAHSSSFGFYLELHVIWRDSLCYLGQYSSQLKTNAFTQQSVR